MKNFSSRLLPFLVFFLQVFLPVSQAKLHQSDGSSVSSDSSATTSNVAESGTPRQQPIVGDEDGLNQEDGNEKVTKALTILRQYEQLNSLPFRSRPGLVGQLGQYLLSTLPTFSAQGPSAGIEGSRSKSLPAQMGSAVRLLEEAAQADNTDAIYLLAQMNFYGNFTHPKDYTEAFRRYHQLALMNGNASAQHMVGFMCATGIGNAVPRDQAKALLYHTFAAKGGDIRSEMTVAYRHHVGIGTAMNCDVAVKHYKRVAEKAMQWYRSGPPGGMSWITDAYRLADDDGGVYGEGASHSSAGHNAPKGGTLDAHAALEDVLEYLDLLSRKGDFKATFSLGRIHYDGQKGLTRDLKGAKHYFMKVAKLYWQRDGRIIETDKPGLEKIATKAAGYLGKMFLRGEGVEQSFERAQIWFNRGIKSGDAGSQYGLGLMYLHGLGLPQDTARALVYLKASADQDFPSALVRMGALHLDQGNPDDIITAHKYFELAGRYAHIESFYFLAEMVDQGLGRNRNCDLAAAYYKTVVEKVEPLLSSFAEANTAYERGDYELALIDYMHAAEQGYEKAQANVGYLLDQEKTNRWSLPAKILAPKPRSSLLQNAALALIFWTRSARQQNIDSMVKMGDYYLNGIGAQADMDKAVSAYTAASDYGGSAQALFNLGWMHENGIGLDQDFHLAKRFYDQALETNDEAYLPVTLSLFKLRVRSAWNTLTNGRINSIQDEPAPKKQWSISEWINNFLKEDGDGYYAEDIADDEYVAPETDPMPGGDADGMYDDILDDGILESLVIIGLAAALVFLIYYRQQHQLAHRQNAAAGEGQQAGGGGPPQAPGEAGIFPQPGDPAFGQWVAGGVGH